MNSDLILICMVGMQGLTLFLLLFLASRGTGLILQLFADLDSKIAEAITKFLSEGGIDYEPPNPLQALLANILQQKMGEMQPRGESGQFVEIKPSEKKL